MTDLAREVAREIPFMRRFARAVAGSQEAGDSCVRLALQALQANPASLDDGVKVGLFRALNDVLNDAAAPGPAAGEGPMKEGPMLASRLEHLIPLGRRLLLLTALEGFPLPQAGTILGLSGDEATAALHEAKDELRRQPPTRVLIIEDEPVIALDIAATIKRNGHTVVGIATTHEEAVELARSGEPGLVLADIQLADDSSGLEAVQEILTILDVPVIFVTAYPERLLTGERPEPTFLITKPFDHDTLQISIAQALAAKARQDIP